MNNTTVKGTDGRVRECQNPENCCHMGNKGWTSCYNICNCPAYSNIEWLLLTQLKEIKEILASR